jgi:hypothetical protein
MTGSEQPSLKPPDLLQHWGFAARDVVPEWIPASVPADPGGQVLLALLQIDGSSWRPPYDELNRALGIRKKAVSPELQNQAESRLRTWLAYFRSLGLVYIDKDGAVRATEVGGRVRALIESVLDEAEAAGRVAAMRRRRELAGLVLPVLGRHLLASPVSDGQYPEGTDIRPYRAILAATRQLDGRIHWQEVCRVLMKCLKEDQLPDAVARIHEAREAAGYRAADMESAERFLGPLPEPRGPSDGNYRDRTISWISQAAFKDLLVDLRGNAQGYRHLNPDMIDLLDSALSLPYESFQGTTPADYVRWLGSAPSLNIPGIDSALTHSIGKDRISLLGQILQRCEEYGRSRFICLTGPAGSGKSSLAKAAARNLTYGRTERILELQFHSGFSYEDFVGGLQPTSAPGVFSRQPGLFMKFNEKALADPGNTYVVVIDELSRADLANTLGEVLTYIEYRGTPFWVAGLGSSTVLSANLVILATMNPQDRSVMNLDDAVVRRFRQVQVGKNPAGLRVILAGNGMSPELIEEVTSWFSEMPDDLPFAQGVFEGVRDAADLRSLWGEVLCHFIRRAGVAVYADAAIVESTYPWRDPVVETHNSVTQNEMVSVPPSWHVSSSVHPHSESISVLSQVLHEDVRAREAADPNSDDTTI